MKRFLIALLVVLPIGAAAQEPSPADDSIRFRTEVIFTPERTETPCVLVPVATAVLPSPGAR